MRYRLVISILFACCALATRTPTAVGQNETCQGEAATLTSADAIDGVITGTDGPDVIVGSPGDDTINALAGDDLVCAGDGEDTVNAGDGNDQVYLENGGGLFIGGDQVYGRACGTQALADDATEVGIGGAGADLLDGGQGADCLKGGPDNDAVIGGSGSDDARGGAGADFVSGDDGNDYVRDSYGSDDVSGGGDPTDTWERCDDGVPDNQDGSFATITPPDASLC